MSRTLRQTTALAAIIAVAMPQALAAQDRIPQDQIAAHRAEAEAGQPALAARLAQELAGGLGVDGLSCADGGTVPACPLLTPEGIAVVLGEDDSILLAPAEAQGAAEPPPEAATPADAEAAPEGQAMPEAIEPEAADTPVMPEPEPEAMPEAAAPAEASTAEPPATDAADGPATADTPEAAAEPVPAAEAQAPSGDAAEVADDAADIPPPPDEADMAQRMTGEGGAGAAAEEAGGETAPADDIAPAEDAAAAVTEGDDGASAETTDTDAGAEADAGTETPDADALADLLTDADTPVGDDIAPDDIAPEARAGEPDEAATRAAEAEAPVAAALDVADDAATEAGEAITVTEAEARSSAEDFATSIAAATQEAAAPAPDDNSDRDLARALLAGLAGYAVGQAVGDNGQVALNSGDRVVITRQDGSQQVLKDDSALMFQPGAQVQTQNFDDGSSRIVVTRDDGSRVVTIRDADLRVLRRTLIHPDGSEVKLIDDTATVAPVQVSDLPPPARPAPPPSLTDEAALRSALEAAANQSRRFTLGQIRDIAGVRALVAPVNIDAITFDTGSAAIRPDQAQQLAALGKVIADYVRADPGEMFLVEGYTDTVGADAMNLALSDRRAESLALALTEYFGVPPENLVVQGYGERFLKVPAEGDIRDNRRVAVRRITDLLARD